jgi:hypothetical protein
MVPVMDVSKQILLEEIRRDVKAARLRALRRDICKAIAIWGGSLTVYYYATRENKYLSPTANLPMYLGILAILLLIPPLYLKLWRYPSLLRGARGRVVQMRVSGERVTRTDRNVGYSNHMGDLMAVNVMNVSVQKANGGIDQVKMLGNHLFDLAQRYYREGDEVERFPGAAYYFNHAAGRRPNRSFCLYCGYLGTAAERRCSRCTCTLLLPDAMKDETE